MNMNTASWYNFLFISGALIGGGLKFDAPSFAVIGVAIAVITLWSVSPK